MEVTNNALTRSWSPWIRRLSCVWLSVDMQHGAPVLYAVTAYHGHDIWRCRCCTTSDCVAKHKTNKGGILHMVSVSLIYSTLQHFRTYIIGNHDTRTKGTTYEKYRKSHIDGLEGGLDVDTGSYRFG